VRCEVLRRHLTDVGARTEHQRAHESPRSKRPSRLRGLVESNKKLGAIGAHTVAKEVDEQEFFYSRETGGTVVSSALKLMNEVIENRYSPNEWNIYGAQASDGDNWNDDSPICRKLLEEQLLPVVQYFAYVEITKRNHQALWREYEQVAATHPETFAQRQIMDVSDIFPVFHDLFQKREAA